MAQKPLSEEFLREIWGRFQEVEYSVTKLARALKKPRQTVDHWICACKTMLGVDTPPAADPEVPPAKPQFTVHTMPDSDLTIDELVDIRKRQFAQRKTYEEATRLVPVDVHLDGPIGILHFGDPHVDDDGTDIIALERHTKLTRTVEGLFGANIGDTTNNWVGRLARLYGDQSTTAKQAWMLAEWMVKSGNWLYMVAGNHDLWSGAGDPMQWIARQQGALYKQSEVRLQLRFNTGANVRVNARHDFSGGSQWNPAHGVMKAVHMGVRDHIAIAGHKHESAYGVLKDPQTGIVCHAIKVASYKIYDRYAKDKGFRDQTLSPCCVTVVDPNMSDSHADMIKVFWDPEEGVEYLKFKRRRGVSIVKGKGKKGGGKKGC